MMIALELLVLFLVLSPSVLVHGFLLLPVHLGLVWVQILGIGGMHMWCDVFVFCPFSTALAFYPGLDATCHSLPTALWLCISGMLGNGRKKLFID